MDYYDTKQHKQFMMRRGIKSNFPKEIGAVDVEYFKGWVGEKETRLGLWLKLDGETYKRFHNIILETENGTAQIDHVILSRYGIFVIETKNYNGWIFGSKDQRSWTQVLFGKKSSFQNPLHQNYKHTRALAQFLNIDDNKTHSVVFFIGDNVELKGDFPPNVLSSGLSGYIKEFTEVLFSNTEFFSLERRLKQFQESNTISSKQHIDNLQARYSSETTCPKCGGKLVRRIAKRGSSVGKEFLGCSNFPSCKFIKK